MWLHIKNREQLFKKLDFNTKTSSAATRKNAVEFPSKYTKCVSSRKPERICERALSLTQRNERKRSFSLVHENERAWRVWLDTLAACARYTIT